MKAKPQNLFKPEDGTMARTWTYVMAHAYEHAEAPGFFNTLIGNLMPGDTIIVKRFDSVIGDPREARLLERRDYEVVALDMANRDVIIEAYGTGQMFGGLSVLEGEAVEVFTPERYIDGDAQVAWNPGRKEHVVSVNGKEVFASSDKELVMQVANGDVPIPEMEAA